MALKRRTVGGLASNKVTVIQNKLPCLRVPASPEVETDGPCQINGFSIAQFDDLIEHTTKPTVELLALSEEPVMDIGKMMNSNGIITCDFDTYRYLAHHQQQCWRGVWLIL